MSSHCVMTLLTLLLAFTAQTFAEETNMNVNGKQMVQALSTEKNHSLAASNETMSHSKALLRGTTNRSGGTGAMGQKLIKGNMSIERNHSVAATDTMSQNMALLRGMMNQSSGTGDGCARLCPMLYSGAVGHWCNQGQCWCVRGGLTFDYSCAQGSSWCAGNCLQSGWQMSGCYANNICICSNNDWDYTQYTC
eukprot:Skav209951  [mRNA]  locus=scaffold102:514198:514776:+ [translate_table: standard]